MRSRREAMADTESERRVKDEEDEEEDAVVRDDASRGTATATAARALFGRVSAT